MTPTLLAADVMYTARSMSGSRRKSLDRLDELRSNGGSKRYTDGPLSS